MKIGVHKIAMAAPNDVSGLKCLIDNGAVDPATIVALIGKTEGNGGANDFTRGFATLSFQLLLAPLLGLTPDEARAAKVRRSYWHVLKAVERVFRALAPEPYPLESSGYVQ